MNQFDLVLQNSQNIFRVCEDYERRKKHNEIQAIALVTKLSWGDI